MPETEECRNAAVSEDYEDVILGYYGKTDLLPTDGCYQRIDDAFAVVYRTRISSEERENDTVSFSRPYCFGLLQEENLETIGVNRIRRIPGFDYRGNGIVIGFVDTGIDYAHPAFLTAAGESRVSTIWDQGDRTGTPPDGFLFGSVFGREEIAAGRAPKDENGHGTFLAGIAAGKEDAEAGFFGVAPLAEIAVVKLKEAKNYLKEYYCMPEGVTAFSEADIMLGVEYLLEYAQERRMPLVLCVGCGCSLGSHGGTVPLSMYLNNLALRPDVCIVTASGNEGNTRHHSKTFLGMSSQEIELYVGERGSGFTMELFTDAIADFNLRLISPTGETSVELLDGPTETEELLFLFDRTTVYVEREKLMRMETKQRLQFRFRRPSGGIWRLQLGRSMVPAEVDVWLPLTEFLDTEVYFTKPDPEVTLCEPSNAPSLFVAGGYSSESGGLAPFSGRGFTAREQQQPTLLAPAVNVFGPFAGGGYIEKSGTSIGAAYAAGCVALFMEFIEEYRKLGSAVPLDTVLVRNLFVLGARRNENAEYPSPSYGYGLLNLLGVFEFLRNL